MNSYLLNRALGTISHQALAKAQNTRLLHHLQPSDDIALSIKSPDGAAVETETPDENSSSSSIKRGYVAHPAGVNNITIDKFEGR